MAIKITENGNVRYENEPNVNRVLFPNVKEGLSPEEITQAVDKWLEDHPEATTTVVDGSITLAKLDSNLQTEISSMDSDVDELKENLDALENVVIDNAIANNNAYNLPITWEQGNLNASGESVNIYVIRSTGYFSVNDYVEITPIIQYGYSATIVAYSGNTDPKTQFVKYINLSDGASIIPDGTYDYFRVKLQCDPTREITPDEGVNCKLRVYSNLPFQEKQNGFFGAVLDIANSYFDVAYDPNDQIVYQHYRGLYSDNTLSDDGKKAIVCSQFVTACIEAVLYKNSRYVKDANRSLWWGWHSDGTGVYSYDDYMIAKEIARYCQSKGWLYPFDTSHNDMKPGDLIFYNNIDTTIDNIGHVAIALNAGVNGYVLIEASDGNIRKVDGKATALVCSKYTYNQKRPTFYAKIPTIASEYTTKRYLNDNNTYNVTAASGTVRVKVYTFKNNLERGFYFFSCNYSGDSYPYLKLTYADGQTENISPIDIFDGVQIIPFYVQMPIASLEVRCSAGAVHTVTDIKLYKGFYMASYFQ